MSGSIVNVLTPHGRRQNVKVQPNTALLKVLEEVCEKYKFDPNEYDLKHHKRIMDLTTSFRFSGLPNNAQLEMVEAAKKRTDAEVELVVQISDGTRLEGKFKPNVTLSNIIQQLCPNELAEDLFAIYMRTEVASDKLDSTSLKDLGLISGRAILRLVHRDPNAAKIQANVALNLQPKQSEAKEDSSEAKNEPAEVNSNMEENREQKMRKTDVEDTKKSAFSTLLQQEIQKKKKELEDLEKQTSGVDSDTTMRELGAGRRLVDNESSNLGTVEKMDVETPGPSGGVQPVEEEEEEDLGEIHILGERSAVLFMQDAAKGANLSDLPDSFFDLNVNDLKLLIKDLRTQAEGTVDQPFMTAKLREMEEEQKQLSVLNRYKTVIIRIQFPNRYVLQGTFTPYETIETVMDFNRSFLANPDIEFYLFTTPPKSILPKESRLFEANCVPSAILHFGSNEKCENFLKEEFLDKISSSKASLMQAFSDRGIERAPDLLRQTSSTENKPSMSQQARKPSSSSNFSSAHRAPTSGDAKLPNRTTEKNNPN